MALLTTGTFNLTVNSSFDHALVSVGRGSHSFYLKSDYSQYLTFDILDLSETPITVQRVEILGVKFVNFDILDPGLYYVKVTHTSPPLSGIHASYSVFSDDGYYLLPVSNAAAEFNNATLTSGEHHPGKVLTASIDIADNDGTAGATKTYIWFRKSGSSFTEITSGTSDSYTVQSDDVGYSIYYSVSFTDDLGNSETSAKYGHGTSVAVHNTAAEFSNATLTSGEHHPGKVLTASIDIADNDGTAGATKTYIWFRKSGSSYTEITSGTSDSYTVQSDDIGYSIYYSVSFTDDLGNSETSAKYGHGTSVAVHNTAAEFSNATLTSGEHHPGKVLTASIDIADNDGTAGATKTYIWFRKSGSSYTEITSGTSDSYTVQSDDVGYSIYYSVSFTDDLGNSETSAKYGHGTSVAVHNTAAEFNNATLTSGEHHPGKVLTASIDIADNDGTAGATKTYIWFRKSGSSYTEITSGTSDSYTVQSDDVGYSIYYSVSFTDDLGNSETSAKYGHGTSVAVHNDAPTISSATSLTTDEDTATAAIAFSGSDADGDTLTFSFSDPAKGSVVDNGNGTFTYTPDANANGSDSFTITANDGIVDVVETINVAIAAVNDAPTIVTSTSLSTDEDTATAAIAFSGSDIDGDTLTFSFNDPAKGSVVDNGNGTFTYTPDANANGSDSFTITANDGTVDVVETINVAIAAVNDAPTIVTSTSLSTDEDTATAAIAFSGSDIDGDTLTFSFNDPAKGSVVDNGNGTFTYTPDANANGSDSFTITANDGTVDVVETINVAIAAVNDAPTIVTSTSLSTYEDTATAAIGFSDADVDGDTLTFTFSDPAKGSVVDNGNGTFTYTPDANANGSDSFTITANDGTVDVVETINVAIAAVNDAPTVSTSTSLTTDEDTATAAIGFSGADVDGDTLTFTFSDPAKGSVVDNGDGTFTYTPDANTNGSDDFTISVNDGTMDVTETINLTVTPDNSPPAGQVGLKGTPVVGQTLTLDLSLLADPDGISQINSYHWLRNDVLLNDDTALAGGYFSNNENLKSYTITDADVGSNMSVKVVYEDGKGLNESIISLSSSVIKQANNFSDLISFDTHGYSSHQPKLVYLENGNIFASWLASEHADGSYNGAYISVFNQNDSVVTPQLFSVSESGRQYSGPVAQLSDGSVVSSWYGETKLDWHPKNYYLSKFRDLDDLSDLQSVDASYRSADYFANIQVVGLTADEQDNIYVLSDYVGYLHLDILDQNLNQIGSTIELEPQTFSNAQSIIHDDKLIVSGMKFDSAAREYKIHLNAYAVTETDFNPESITHQMAANPEHNASAYVRDTFITLEGNVAIIWREGSHGDVGLPYLQEFDVATLNPLTDAIQLTENDTHKHVTEVKIVAMGDDSYLMASSYYHRVLELDDTGHLQERYKSDIYIKYLDKDFNSLSENKLIGEGDSLSLTTSDFGDVYLSYSFEGEVHVEKLTNYAPEITIAETLNIVEDSTNNTFFLSTFDANDDPITYNFLDPEHGSVSLNGNDKFVYTPDADFAGTENITLVARDQLLSTTHNFSISVRNTNDAPIISTTTSLTTDEDKATVEIAFSGSDVDVGDTLTFSFSDPAKGSVVDNGDGTFTYTPAANANGSDSFTLTANDGTVDVEETISVAINAANDAPTVSTSTSLTTDEDTATAAIEFSGSDVDGDTLTFSFSDPAKGSVVNNGNGTFTYTPAANANGSDSFTLTANDGTVDVEETISVAINAANDAPTVSTSTSLTTDEDTATAAIEFSGSDVDGDTLTFSFSDPAKGSVVNNGNGTFTYTPAANANGSDSFTLTANDGTVDVEETISVAINAANDAPTVSTSTSLTTDEDTATAAIEFSGSDVDGDTLTFSFSDPAKGSVVNNGNGTFTYTPAANANGSDSFTLTANDGTVDVEETISVAINAANDAPTVSTSTSLTTDEDTATAAIEFSGSDVDGDTLTFSFSDPAKGSVVNNGNGTFTYTPAANANGSDSFTLTANDGTVDVEETISVAINAANDAPTVSTSTSLTTDEDTATAAIEFSGSDVDGDGLTFSFSDPEKGSVVNNGDGTFTYTPDANANGSDSFTLTANDGTVDVEETINVAINAVNDAPLLKYTIDVSSFFYGDDASPINGDQETFDAFSELSFLGNKDAAVSFSYVNFYEPSEISLTTTGIEAESYTYNDSAFDLAIVDAAWAFTVSKNEINYNMFAISVPPSDAYPYEILLLSLDSERWDIKSQSDLDELFEQLEGLPEVRLEILQPETDFRVSEFSNVTITRPVTIIGDHTVGTELRALVPDWVDPDGVNDATFIYQWLRDGDRIVDGNKDSYVLVKEDSGTSLSVKVNYVDDGGSAEELTSEITPLITEILSGTSESDEFEFALTEQGGHGYIALRDFDSLEDELVLTSYTPSKIIKTLDGSGYDKFVFTEDSDVSTLVIETAEVASSLKLSNLANKTLKLASGDLLVNEHGELSLSSAKEIDGVKVDGISSFKTDIKLADDTNASDPISIGDVIAQIKHIIGMKELKSYAHEAGDTNNDGDVNLTDVLATIKHIIGREELNTFDLVTDNGFAVNALDAESKGNLKLVINGDADQSHADWDILASLPL